MSDRPDLAHLAARARTLVDALNEYAETLAEASEAALGECDPETEEETVPGNGDTVEFYDQARKKVVDVRLGMTGVIDLLATQQGYREFEAQGVDV